MLFDDKKHNFPHYHVPGSQMHNFLLLEVIELFLLLLQKGHIKVQWFDDCPFRYMTINKHKTGS